MAEVVLRSCKSVRVLTKIVAQTCVCVGVWGVGGRWHWLCVRVGIVPTWVSVVVAGSDSGGCPWRQRWREGVGTSLCQPTHTHTLIDQVMAGWCVVVSILWGGGGGVLNTATHYLQCYCCYLQIATFRERYNHLSSCMCLLILHQRRPLNRLILTEHLLIGVFCS